MAHDREEQNPQQTRGRNGVGSPPRMRKISKGELPNQSRARGIRVGSRTTPQKISEGDVPKQEGRKRGRPSSKLSEHEKKKKKNEVDRRYRKKIKVEFERLQDFENQFLEEFGPMTPKHLKENLGNKFGVTEEALEEIRKSAPPKELLKVCQTLEDETPVRKKLFQDKEEEDSLDGWGFWSCGQSPAKNEPINQDAAEFSKFQQSEIKWETMCDEFGVTEEGLEGRNLGKLRLGPLVEEKRAFNSIEEADKFLSEDDEVKLEEPSAEKKKRLTEIEEELQALIGSQSTTPGGKEAVMNEPNNQDAYLTSDCDGCGCCNTDQFLLHDGSSLFNIDQLELEALIGSQSLTPGGKEAVMNEPNNQNALSVDDFSFCYDEFSWCNSDQLPMDDDFISSLIFDKVQSQTLHQPKPVLKDRVNDQNLMAPTGATKAWDKVGTSKLYKGTADGKENAIGMMSMYQECTGKTSAAADVDRGSKGATTCAPWKGNGSRGTALVVPVEKIGHQKEGKKVAAAVQFR